MVTNNNYGTNTKTKKELRGNAPLLCWDVFIYAYKRRLQLFADLQRLATIKRQYNWFNAPAEPDFALIWLNKTVIITTPSLQIIHATENIFDMNGYRPHEVIGNRPSMFQGRETTQESKNIIRMGVDAHTAFETPILNYKKDGTPYTCYVKGFPVFNKAGVLVNFMAFENRVA